MSVTPGCAVGADIDADVGGQGRQYSFCAEGFYSFQTLGLSRAEAVEYASTVSVSPG